jgi:hypothetical protein
MITQPVSIRENYQRLVNIISAEIFPKINEKENQHSISLGKTTSNNSPKLD